MNIPANTPLPGVTESSPIYKVKIKAIYFKLIAI